MFSIVEDVQPITGYRELVWKISSVHWRDTMIHVRGHYESIKGCSVHWKVIIKHASVAADFSAKTRQKFRFEVRIQVGKL